MRAGNSKFIKNMNRQNVLEVIRESQEISRTEIMRRTGLTAPTVSDITRSFLRRGLIREAGTAESTGGRRATMFRLNPEARYAVGLDLEDDQVRASLLDFSGQEIFSLVHRMPEAPDFDRLVQALVSVTVDLVRQSETEPGRILGVGVSVPGLVDMESGDVHLIPILHLKNIPLGRALKAALPYPFQVYVINDAFAATTAEKWFGAARDDDNFLCVVARSGIGAGFFLNGELYQGPSGVAGEIGHQTLQVDGPLCDCGNYGCLESFAGRKAIIRYTQTQLKQGEKSLLTELAGSVEEVTLDTICEAAARGDSLALRVFQRTGMYLGVGLANIINILNPGRVILSGDLLKYRDYLTSMHDTLETKILGVQRSACEIAYSALGSGIYSMGAGVLLLQDFHYAEPGA